jgi:hypothetical protein
MSHADLARATINKWFADPSRFLPKGWEFGCVAVFERQTHVKRGLNRMAVLLDTVEYGLWQRRDTSPTLPFTVWPSMAWKKARFVGYATTEAEALSLMFP